MQRKLLFVMATLLVAAVSLSFYSRYDHHDRNTIQQQAIIKPADSSQSKIQLVFALDATGSMMGLIGAAKEKIWSIAGSLAQADPAPSIEMGLLFYRDRGDAFVTKMVPLSKDLDQVYAQLMQIKADGGGDLPESVNQALYESVSKFSWDTSHATYKTIFLVGDCPPHMDYNNDVKYPVSCQAAKQKDIVLNTILMGDNSDAKKIWRDIAICNQGSFTQVNMNANDIQVFTPYDSIIAVISDKLDDSRIYYGVAADQLEYKTKINTSKAISNGSKSNVKAQRAEFNSSMAGKKVYYGEKELVENYKNKTIRLDTISKDNLPDEMKNMTANEKENYIEQKIAARDSLQKDLTKYMEMRRVYIESDLKKRKASDVDSSFSNKIYLNIKKQTEKKNIYLKGETKY